ncbi:unnamed protein product [Urochloa humidicola]
MLLRSGRATYFPGPLRRSGGSSCGFDEAAARLGLKRKSSVEIDAAPLRQVRKSSPASSCKQLPVLLPPPEVGSSAGDDNNSVDEISDEAAVAEFIKMFPNIPLQSAPNVWLGFVNDAKACIKHYNKKYQADFVYKHAHEYANHFLREPEGSHYFHINFHAQDKKGHSQLFFGEIRVSVAPKEEDVPCCCSVSPSDAGGKRLETIAESVNYKFPAWGTAGMDKECCYGCSSVMKHPKGACYVAGHVADPRQYFVPCS